MVLHVHSKREKNKKRKRKEEEEQQQQLLLKPSRGSAAKRGAVSLATLYTTPMSLVYDIGFGTRIIYNKSRHRGGVCGG